MPEDGTYRLIVRDSSREAAQGPVVVYRLAIRSPGVPDAHHPESRRGHAAAAERKRSSLRRASRRGETRPVRCRIQRRDEFAGEIAVEGARAATRRDLPGAVLGE